MIRGISALLICLLIASCNIFGGAESVDISHVQQISGVNPVSTVRIPAMKKNKRFVCLYALSGKPYSFMNEQGTLDGIEPALIRVAANAAGLKVEFRQVEPERIYGLLRNGTGDAAFAMLDPSHAELAGFSVLSVYSQTPRAAFIVRRDEPFLPSTIGKAFEQTDSETIRAAFDSGVSGATVRISSETDGSSLSVKVGGE